ncbi:MAG: CotH kinase family protein [Gemmatimonas sp.]
MTPASSRAQGRRAATLALVLLLVGCRNADTPTAPPALPPPPVVEVGRFPTMQIVTTGGAPITSRETYVGGTWRLIGPDSALLRDGSLEVRGRGNSTWSMPKKPYRLRLTTGAELLGMPSNRHWALLANYADKTLLRNDLVFDLAQRMGWTYVPRSRFVHLQLNGRYEGVYQLTEHIRIDASRVNIPEVRIADTSAAAITGGYLLEVDELYGEDFCWNTPRVRMPVCAKSPETLRQPGWERQQRYITGYFDDLENALYGPSFADPVTGYAAYIDVPSAVDYFLVNELVKNVDGNLRRSTFLTKPRGGKLYFGPLWDFDITLGNVNYGGADAVAGWQIRSAPWFARLWQDPAFVQRVKLRWQQIRNDGTFASWRQAMLARWDYMSVEQRRNFERWPILDSWVWPNRVVTGSYNGEMAAMQEWLTARTNWLDDQLRP